MGWAVFDHIQYTALQKSYWNRGNVDKTLKDPNHNQDEEKGDV